MSRFSSGRKVSGTIWLASVACLVAAAPSAQAQTSDQVARGRELAAQLCSGCHVIDPRQAGVVSDGVPTFMSIAARLDDRAIESMILVPSHPAMPAPPLDYRQRQDVVAYIRSLAAD